MEGARNMPQTNVRLPIDLKGWLLARAKVNHRSMTSELVAILSQAKEREQEARQ